MKAPDDLRLPQKTPTDASDRSGDRDPSIRADNRIAAMTDDFVIPKFETPTMAAFSFG